jgi:ATP-dependent protease ClpP protease subunit
MNNKWFEIKSLSEEEGEASIYDTIGGWGISVQNFKAEWDKLKNKKRINLRIHSRGGNVMDAAAMATMFEQHPAELTATIEGVAASCAAQLVQSAKKRKMAKGGFMMIHKPWAGPVGNADDLRKAADFLDKIQSGFAAKLSERSKKLSVKQVNAMLDKETWMTAEEALDNGFVDELLPEMKAAAFAGNCEFSNIPDNAKKFFPEQFGLDSNNNSADAGKQKPKGAKAMSKEMLSKMKELFGAEFATEAYAADKNLETAAIEFVGKLKEEITGLKKAEGEAKAALSAELAKVKTLEAANADLKKKTEGVPPLPASPQGSATAPQVPKDTFESKLEEFQKAGMSSDKAVAKIAAELPDLHKEFINKKNNR